MATLGRRSTRWRIWFCPFVTAATAGLRQPFPDREPGADRCDRRTRRAGAARQRAGRGTDDGNRAVDRSHIGINWIRRSSIPTPKSGKELTARRREKYSATELSRRSPAEEKIAEALKQPTQIEFVETPLKDVIDYLKDLHHIEIQLDSAALKEEGIDENTPVTKNLKGISLRSALKLMLDEMHLTYVIHNDVLLITSQERPRARSCQATRPTPAEMFPWILPGYNRKVPTYEPPVFRNNPAVFYDLVSYAPGMHTNLADVLAVLEAEAPADAIAAKPGKIDDRARRLIERARGAGWQTATITDAKGRRRAWSPSMARAATDTGGQHPQDYASRSFATVRASGTSIPSWASVLDGRSTASIARSLRGSCLGPCLRWKTWLAAPTW